MKEFLAMSRFFLIFRFISLFRLRDSPLSTLGGPLFFHLSYASPSGNLLLLSQLSKVQPKQHSTIP